MTRGIKFVYPFTCISNLSRLMTNGLIYHGQTNHKYYSYSWTNGQNYQLMKKKTSVMVNTEPYIPYISIDKYNNKLK